MRDKRFELLPNAEHKAAWDALYAKVDFRPNCNPLAKTIPFTFLEPTTFAVYDLTSVTPRGDLKAYEASVQKFMEEMCAEDDWLYALDWQHSAFRMWPYAPSPTEPYELAEFDPPVNKPGWETYRAYYPGYIPDGDYYFFVAPDMRWGYLGTRRGTRHGYLEKAR